QQDRSLHAIEDLKLRMALSRMRKLPLLAGVSESFFKAVASQLVPVAFKRGQWIFHQGDPGRYLYFISRGRIEIVDEAKDLALAQLPEGSVFGEMALLDERPRVAGARCQNYGELYQLDRETFQQLTQSFPEFQQRLAQVAATRQENLMPAAEEAMGMPVLEILTPGTGTAAGPVYCTLSARNLVFEIAQDSIGWCMHDSWARLLQPQSVSVGAESLLVADTGNHRILELERASHQLKREWGDERLPLRQPACAIRLSNGNTLIADTGNQRLLEVGPEAELLWEYTDPELLEPVQVSETPGGHLLVVDAALGLVREIERSGKVLWQHGDPMPIGDAPLLRPAWASRLANGNTLIADSGHDRVLEVGTDGSLVWTYAGSAAEPLPGPSFCERGPDGQTLIQFAKQQELRRVDGHGRVLWACCVRV
ncbi:MAG TPA: cyclic nucleotide-binding domain-containing protein, partial [Candidatus Obscuribacterales bacterium]